MFLGFLGSPENQAKPRKQANPPQRVWFLWLCLFSWFAWFSWLSWLPWLSWFPWLFWFSRFCVVCTAQTELQTRTITQLSRLMRARRQLPMRAGVAIRNGLEPPRGSRNTERILNVGCPVPSSSKGTIRCTDLGFVSYQALFLTKEPTCSLAATVLAYKTCVLKRASRENAVVRATENPAARSAPPSVGKCGCFFFEHLTCFAVNS